MSTLCRDSIYTWYWQSWAFIIWIFVVGRTLAWIWRQTDIYSIFPEIDRTDNRYIARYFDALSSNRQATGLDAWASRVKCPARFVSHLHEICIYIWVVYSLCFFCYLFITVTWWYVWCFEWVSGNQEEVQACLVTLWLFIISCYSLYKTTLGLLCSWFENNLHFHKYSMDFHV